MMSEEGRVASTRRKVAVTLLGGLAVATLAIAPLGCSGGESGGAWTGTVGDSAGITIVSNQREEMWTAGERWSVREVLRIGAIEAEPAYMFGQIIGIGVTSDERIFVLDQQAQELRLFGPDGNHLGSFGGPGSGPGELSPQAAPVLIGRGDTVFVPDLANQRVNRYAPDGTPAGSYRLSLEGGLPAAWAARPSGQIVNQIRPFVLPNQPGADTIDVDAQMDAIVARDAEGAPLDTLLKMESGKTLDLQAGTATFFVAEPTWALAGEDKLLFGVNDQYSINVYGPAGELQRIIRMPAERMPVTDADEGVFMDILEEAWLNAGVPESAIPTIRSRVSFAEFFPVYMRFLAGPEGSIWVQQMVAPSSLSADELEDYNPLLSIGGSDWDVFDEEGRFLGVVTTPPRFMPLLFQGTRIYGVWGDELDVQHVMVLQIDGPAA